MESSLFLSSGELQVTGLRELEAALNRLPEKVARRVLVRAGQRGIAVFQKFAIALAPRKTGALKRGIRTQVRTFWNGVKGATLRWKLGLVNKPKDKSVFYGRFIEKGTRSHEITVKRAAALSNGVVVYGRRVQVRGVAGAKRVEFFRMAFDGKKQEVIDVFRVELAAVIDAAVLEARR